MVRQGMLDILDRLYRAENKQWDNGPHDCLLDWTWGNRKFDENKLDGSLSRHRLP